MSQLLFLDRFKMQQRGWKDGLVGKVPAMEAWGPAFGFPAPMWQLCVVTYISNPSAGRSRGRQIPGQPV